MVTWEDVTRWSPEPLAGMVGVLNARYNQLLACADELRQTSTPQGWSGQEATNLASAHSFVIGDDGSIADHGPPPVCTADDPDGSLAAQDRRRIMVELQDRVREVLKSAEDVDNDFCAVLDRE